MKIGICGSQPVTFKLPQDYDYIGADRGVETLLEQGIKPILGVGDFDSINNIRVLKDLKIERLPVRKDVTDTHHALEYAINKGYDEIILYGVTGGRLDHFMAVMCLLEKYHEYDIKIIDEENIIMLLQAGSHQIDKDQYKYFSLFALDDSIIDIQGAAYPLNQYHLFKEDPLCVSNQVKDNHAIITTSKDIILIKSK